MSEDEMKGYERLLDAIDELPQTTETADMMLTRCSACGAVEVDVEGPYRIVTIDGETYRTGYGCEVCS